MVEGTGAVLTLGGIRRAVERLRSEPEGPRLPPYCGICYKREVCASWYPVACAECAETHGLNKWADDLRRESKERQRAYRERKRG